MIRDEQEQIQIEKILEKFKENIKFVIELIEERGATHNEIFEALFDLVPLSYDIKTYFRHLIAAENIEKRLNEDSVNIEFEVI